MGVKRRFEFVEHEAVKDWQCIRIRNGRYKGLVYHYDCVSAVEDPDGKGARLKFNFEAVDNPRNVDLDEKKLHTLLGDILVYLLDEKLKGGDGLISSALSVEEVETMIPDEKSE